MLGFSPISIIRCLEGQRPEVTGRLVRDSPIKSRGGVIDWFVVGKILIAPDLQMNLMQSEGTII